MSRLGRFAQGDKIMTISHALLGGDLPVTRAEADFRCVEVKHGP